MPVHFGDPVVEFYDNVTENLIWVASLKFLPKEDDVVTYQGTDYEVNRVAFKFTRVATGSGQPPYTGDLTEAETQVYVTEQ